MAEVQREEEGKAEGESGAKGGKRRWPLVAILLVLLGGGGAGAWFFLGASGDEAESEAPAAAVQEAYLTILSRPPTADEETAGVEFLSAPEPTGKVLCRDFVWSLLCSSEFRLNH